MDTYMHNSQIINTRSRADKTENSYSSNSSGSVPLPSESERIQEIQSQKQEITKTKIDPLHLTHTNHQKPT